MLHVWSVSVLEIQNRLSALLSSLTFKKVLFRLVPTTIRKIKPLVGDEGPWILTTLFRQDLFYRLYNCVVEF